MANPLTISIGQFSDRGRKEANQDFHGALVPDDLLRATKGIAVAIADGISSSRVGRIAAESAIKSFLTDYYCTSEAWSVKTSAQRVIQAANSWLYSETRRSQNPYDKDRGYVCTLSVLVLKSTTAHLFHVGDSRIYRVAGQGLEQLTEDHRIAISSEETYLSRALGANQQVEIDYRAVPLEAGDVFVLTTDGVCDFVAPRFVAETIREYAWDLDSAARCIAETALENGSGDNLTVQIVRIDALPESAAGEHLGRVAELPPAPVLEPRQVFEGYRVLRVIHGNARSHIYLVEDLETGALAALKVPSLDLREDPDHLRRFMMEEWVARRIDNAHVLGAVRSTRPRRFLYVVTEYIEGQTLAQWMIDNPRPDLETVRGIVEQIARGLNAFHRKEMLHQDLRPANVMIDRTGTVKIIDFGATRVAGVVEAAPSPEAGAVPGTLQYTAPEYLLGEGGTRRSDLYSLGVIAYQMLTGRLPYGARMAATRTRAQQAKVRYYPARDADSTLPAWIDAVLAKAVAADPARRYAELSEFVFALRDPGALAAEGLSRPLIERNPLLFWKGLSLILTFAVIGLLIFIARR
jgi:serine/threonine protein phosphatase PrpC